MPYTDNECFLSRHDPLERLPTASRSCPAGSGRSAPLVAGGAATATPRIDEGRLSNLGFKVPVATTKVQQDWVRSLPPGRIRPTQRTGKMRKATARDLTDPFLGARWADLGW